MKKLVSILLLGLAVGAVSVFAETAAQKKERERERLLAIQAAACEDAKAEDSLSKWQRYDCD